jgi:hypothetical protein
MFNRLRMVVKYGVAIKAQGAVDANQVLSNIRFKTAPKKTTAPTEAQIMSMVAEADARGLTGFATGMLLQWWLGLRSVDVRGQWFDIEDSATGGLVRHSTVKRRTGTHVKTSRWQDGLTWDMISPDFTRIEKVISKTATSRPNATVFHLDQLPDVRARLELLARKGRVGPVILSSDGLPYTKSGWSQIHLRIRNHLGLPDHVKNMDTRAGAITHAQSMGATLEDMRDMATHSTSATTQRYLRDGEQARDRVIKLRMK